MDGQRCRSAYFNAAATRWPTVLRSSKRLYSRLWKSLRQTGSTKKMASSTCACWQHRSTASLDFSPRQILTNAGCMHGRPPKEALQITALAGSPGLFAHSLSPKDGGSRMANESGIRNFLLGAESPLVSLQESPGNANSLAGLAADPCDGCHTLRRFRRIKGEI